MWWDRMRPNGEGEHTVGTHSDVSWIRRTEHEHDGEDLAGRVGGGVVAEAHCRVMRGTDGEAGSATTACHRAGMERGWVMWGT